MTDDAGHLDLDALADVLAGERDDAHLRSCRSCDDRLDELRAAQDRVRIALELLPPPPPPEGLSARLASALDQERSPQQGGVVRPLRERLPAWLPAVAASAVLVLAGAVGWSALDPAGRGGRDATTSAAGSGGSESGSGSADAGAEAGTTSLDTATELAAPPTDSGTDWADERARPAALDRLLGRGGSSTAGTAAPPADALARLRDPAALAECVAALPGGAGDVLAVDYARYAGVPAVAVVRREGPGSVTVTVVAGSCSATDPAVLSTSLLPRP